MEDVMSPIRIGLFLVIAGALLFGIHYYFWARLVRDTGLPAPWGPAITRTLAALGASIILGLLLSRAAPRNVASPVMWVVCTWMGVMFFLFVLLGAVDLGRLLFAGVRRIAQADALDPSRRMFLARVFGGGVGFVTLGLSAASLYEGLREVAVKRVRVPLAKLPPGHAGYTIVQISDIHVGPTIGRAFIEQLVARVNALKPDLVAITGDLVDGSVAELGPLVAPLRDLRAKDGVFFCTGNHEYYSGVEDWLRYLPTLGVRVLSNAHVRLDAFDLAGVDDWSASPDIARALDGRDASRALVLLAHQPKQILEAEKLGVGLQLSGHTHGGQLFPFNYLVHLQQPYVAGLHRHGDAMIYVSSGTGYWGPPMRLGAPAEITVIELAIGRRIALANAPATTSMTSTCELPRRSMTMAFSHARSRARPMTAMAATRSNGCTSRLTRRMLPVAIRCIARTSTVSRISLMRKKSACSGLPHTGRQPVSSQARSTAQARSRLMCALMPASPYCTRATPLRYRRAKNCAHARGVCPASVVQERMASK
jgi:predicted MPP superfamily phosphohydrolase